MKRVVMMMLDGLRADQAYGLDLPHIGALRARGTTFLQHRAIFPSATRASSASVATGVYPRRHGLHGNQMALAQGRGYVSHDVGKPEFFDTWRAASGGTLRAKTLAERAKDIGGGIVFGNASPGAALAHDPDGYGHVYHRAVSLAPGRRPADDPLSVTLSPDGDRAMTARFIDEVLGQRRPATAVLWLGNPDDTQHDHPLGSPASLEAIRVADGLVGRVAQAIAALDPGGDEILFMVGSDHGHETVRAYVAVEAEMIAAGFKTEADDVALVLAPQGTGFLVYAAEGEEGRVADLAGWLATRPWCGKVVAGEALAAIGHGPAAGGVALAVGMASTPEPNAYGVPGTTYVATRFETAGRTLGNGSHGGMGVFETHPFLLAVGAGFAAGAVTDEPTSLVDIAPTALAHLGLDPVGLDGRPLQHRPPITALR